MSHKLASSHPGPKMGQMRHLALLVWLPAAALAQAAPLDPAQVKAALCKEPCAVLTSAAVGHDPAGRDLYVASVASPHKAGEHLPKDADEAERRCLAEAFELLTVHGGRVVGHQPIVTVRAKGCGRAREEIRLSGDRLVYDVQGGQLWTHVELTTWKLAPVLRLIERYDERFAQGGAPGQTVDRQLDTGMTQVETRLPYCGGAPRDGEERPHATFRYIEIPQVKPSGDWRAPSFGPRALTVDSAKHGGFLLSGTAGTPQDAQFSVAALAPEVLWLELSDPRLSERESFEIYLGEPLPPFPSACVPLPGARRPAGDGGPVQSYVVPVRPNAAQPDPPDLKVERAEVAVNGERRVRLRIGLPRAPGSLAVVFADSDDAHTIVRRIGTATVKADEPLSLGTLSTSP